VETRPENKGLGRNYGPPPVAVKSQEDVERAHPIMESAHTNCFVSNSITSSERVLPEFRIYFSAS
jgi:organic hydroperoxide reductase OsmC/OhrA